MWDWLNEMVEVPRWALYLSGIVSVMGALAFRDITSGIRRRRRAASSARRAYMRQATNRD